MGVWSRCLSSPSSSLSFSSFVLVFGVVRAQLCEHARYPRTPLCFLVLSCSLFSSRPAFPFFLRLSGSGMAAGGGSPCVTVFGGHDGDG